jgi:hypothetical protein
MSAPIACLTRQDGSLVALPPLPAKQQPSLFEPSRQIVRPSNRIDLGFVDLAFEPVLVRCEECCPLCDAFPCENADPKGPDEIGAADAAKE